MVKRMFWLLAAAVMLGLLPCCSGQTAPGKAEEGDTADANGTYYPGKTWRTSTPEAQGMDSAKLVEMFQKIREQGTPIHSFLIIRHGYLVAEAYFDPFTAETHHDLFSATKSFTSTLIGIAIDEGKVKGVDQRVLDFFPGVKVSDDSQGTSAMTLEHLLTMTAGHKADSVDNVYGSRDWARDFFSLPFAHKPGSKFLYDSGASHLLAAVLHRATGESADNYAKERLFQPLGISDYSWEKSAEGLNTGGWGIRMKPADMARFGYLALHKGAWRGKQLVSAQWIEKATQKHIDGDWDGTPADGYGYQWWINPFGGYRADGFAGQFIYVLPEQDIVAVVTSGINYSEEWQPARYMSDYVLPAVKSGEALPENQQAQQDLAALLQELAHPTPVASPALPETASRISGQLFETYSFLGSFSLDFSKPGICTFHFNQSGKHSFPVGLDGAYRVTKASRVGTLQWYPPYEAIALKGRWADSSTFVMDWQYVGEPYHEEYKFVFDGGGVTVEVTEYVVGGAGPMTPHAVYTGKLAK